MFLIPKVVASRSADDVAVEFLKYDPSKPEEMAKYQKFITLIKPKQFNVINATGFKPGEVVSRVVARLNSKIFNQASHTRCWHHFNARPPKGATDASLCSPQFCSYDAVHKDYVYTQHWVDFLVEKLSDEATYAVVMKPKTQQPLAIPTVAPAVPVAAGQ